MSLWLLTVKDKIIFYGPALYGKTFRANLKPLLKPCQYSFWLDLGLLGLEKAPQS